jgi:hypothetical protein
VLGNPEKLLQAFVCTDPNAKTLKAMPCSLYSSASNSDKVITAPCWNYKQLSPETLNFLEYRPELMVTT